MILTDHDTSMILVCYSIAMAGIEKNVLTDLYIVKKKSAREISDKLNCSEHKVNYWLNKYGIPKRSISDSIYALANPDGDPFKSKNLRNNEEWFLFGLGLGLYWGEGTKANKYSVRLGNTDPALIKKFIEFLEVIYCIKRSKIRLGLQIFSDMDTNEALNFWAKELNFNKSHFQKVIVTPARGVGNYRHKTKHGVLTIQFGNKKLRDIIVTEISKLQKPR